MEPDAIVIEGVPPWDGRYEFDRDTELTVREWGWLKRLCGYLPGTFGEGIAGLDPELMSALAVVALVRAGRIRREEVPETYERFGDSVAGRIYWRLGEREVEAEANPPLPASSSAKPNGSGASSSTNGETSAETPDSFGISDSATSLFGPARSAS